MGLADVLTAAHKLNAVPEGADDLSRAVQFFLTGSKGSQSQTDVLRMSGMYFLCPREAWLQYWHPKENKKFTAAAQMKMQLGTDFHHYMQNYVLGPMGILWGTWHPVGVEAKNLDVRGFHPYPENPNQWEFIEESFWDEIYRISGHCDGRVSLARLDYFNRNQIAFRRHPHKFYQEIAGVPEGEFAILELKSGDDWFFEKLVNREVDIQDYYKMQSCLYMRSSELKKTYFLYTERKDFRMYSKIFEFDQGWIDTALRKAKKIWNGILNEEIPMDGVCSSPSDKRAKSCCHVHACFDPLINYDDYVAKGKEQANITGRKLLQLKVIQISF